MLTISSCPKLFEDEFCIIQDNAVKSWENIAEKDKILLCGVESIEYCQKNYIQNYSQI
jgi:hypothetical protein